MNLIKYNNFDEIKTNQEVRICGEAQWWGLRGIVENINKTEKRAEIFSMVFPDLRYIVREDNLGDIELIVE